MLDIFVSYKNARIVGILAGDAGMDEGTKEKKALSVSSDTSF